MKTMKNIILGAFILIALQSGHAWTQNPAPAPEQSGSALLTGAVIHTGEKVFENGVIGFRDGKIILVGDMSTIRINHTEYDTIIEAAGKHIYPGLIALNTNLGLREIELVRATNDYRETGDINASARALIAYNTDSRVTPTIRSNGVLLAQVVPEGGMVSGNSSVMELDGWNWQDAVYKADDGLHVRWPSQVIRRTRNDKQEKEAEKKKRGKLEELVRFFADARAYMEIPEPEHINISFEAVRGLYENEKKLFVHCEQMKDIVQAIDIFTEMNLKPVIVGGHDAWRVIPKLKEHDIEVVLVNTHRLPAREDDDIFQPYSNAYQLEKAGIRYAIGSKGFWQVRNLSFQAGTATTYGLTKNEALRAITSSPAMILGISDAVGTLNEGLDATLIVTNGDIFDMRSSFVELAFIRGRLIDLDNIQKRLYHKYRSKYGFSE